MLLMLWASSSSAVESRCIGEERPPSEGKLTSAGSFYVMWWTEPEAIPLNEMFTLHVCVVEPNDHTTLILEAVITADAWMPAHNHGTTLQPRVQSHGDGTATVTGMLLHMEGQWELRFGVAAGARMERVSFPIQLGP